MENNNEYNQQNQNTYNNYGYNQAIGYNNQNNNYYTNENNKYKKKKKKHKFLRFLLTVVIIIALFNIFKYICDKIADTRLNNVIVDYPFTSFENDSNSMWYITDNFELYDYKNNADINIDWKSSNKKLVKINKNKTSVEINRPSESSQNVELILSHKFLIGKSERIYNITVISSKAKNPEDFTIITKEDLQNNVYNRNMKATLDKSGNITSMYGDFKNTYIYNEEDGIAWIEAHRNTLGISDKYEFVCKQINQSSSMKTYLYTAYYNGVEDSSQSIHLSVKYDTFELFNVNCEIANRNKDINTDGILENLNYLDIATQYIKSSGLGSQILGSMAEENIIYEYKGITYIAHKMSVQTDKSYYNIYIDLKTGNIINYEDGLIDITGTGKDEVGNKKTFDITEGNLINKALGKSYYMIDPNRNITTYRQNGPALSIRLYNKSGNKWWLFPAAFSDAFWSEMLDTVVSSNKKEFKDSEAVGAHANITKAYNWYKDTFGIVSYDGKGAPIILNVNERTLFDNAYWNGAILEFAVTAAKNNKYTWAQDPSVLAHEYTHAVFMSKTSNINVSQDDNPSIAAFNEGYADVFAHLVTNSKDWCIGKNKDKKGNDIILRDSANFNNSKIKEVKYPTQWHGENWQDEEHIGSVIISHIGWEMYNDKAFTNKDIANIWYDSLCLGYTNNSDFVSVRRNIIKAMDNSGYSKELQDKVATWFDEVAIYDDEYVLQTTDNSVEGDIILDNTTERRYIIVTSILGSALSDTPIYIYEEKSEINEDEVKQINKILQDTLDNVMGDTTNLKGNKIKVEYKQAPKWQIDILEKFVSNSRAKLSDIITGTISDDTDESKSIIDTILDLSILCTVEKSTPYEFYDNIGVDMGNIKTK